MVARERYGANVIDTYHRTMRSYLNDPEGEREHLIARAVTYSAQAAQETG